MLTQITAQQLYDKLLADGIVNSTGEIILTLNGISVKIETKDSVGHMLQDWLNSWAKSKNIYLRANPATQEFPDFYLSESNEDKLLEIKSFDFNASPNFDIANFEAYFRSLIGHPKKLDADYLIFGYTIENGILTIKNIWLKKIWEICTSSKDWDLKMQVSHGIVKNIRPVVFTSARKNIAQPFSSKIEFLNAIQGVLNQYETTTGLYKTWLDDFKIAYQTATGNELT